MKYIKMQAVRFLFRAKTRLRHPEKRRGQTLVEYALIIAVLSIVAIGVLINMGQAVKGVYTMINSQISIAGQSH
jgi:Flp pilus assembly pilin Flp